MPYQFYIVDVFAEQQFTGNQLAVVMGAQDIADNVMLKIAQEMNYAETTFILSDEAVDRGGYEPGYDVRIFTPAAELLFAGHPTLGTASIIRDKIIGEAVHQVTLNLQAGPIPVTFEDNGVLWMRQNPAEFGHKFSAAAMAKILGIEPDEVHSDFPVQSVTTGLPFILVPLRSMVAVRRAEVNVQRFKSLLESTDDPVDAKMILVFSPETYHEENDLNARMFGHLYAVPEDPATGSANGCLAAYLSHYEYFGSAEVDCCVEQGYEIHRPSLLLLKARPVGGIIEINVGGKVVLTAQGELLI